MSDGRPAYIVTHEAWYAESAMKVKDSVVAEISIGHYCPDDGGVDEWGEFTIAWYKFASRDDPAPRLMMFSDSWRWLVTDPGRQLMGFLARNHSHDAERLTPELLVEWLDEHGFVDDTARTGPYGEKGSTMAETVGQRQDRAEAQAMKRREVTALERQADALTVLALSEVGSRMKRGPNVDEVRTRIKETIEGVAARMIAREERTTS